MALSRRRLTLYVVLALLVGYLYAHLRTPAGTDHTPSFPVDEGVVTSDNPGKSPRHASVHVPIHEKGMGLKVLTGVGRRNEVTGRKCFDERMSDGYFGETFDLKDEGKVLPSFMIIGVQKGGSTVLHHYLEQHPQLVPPMKKEIYYFDHLSRYGNGTNAEKYMTYFASRENHPNQMTWDASVTYMSRSGQVAPRVHHYFPCIRIIVLMRDPIDRAYSQHRMRLFKGRPEIDSPTYRAIMSRNGRGSNFTKILNHKIFGAGIGRGLPEDEEERLGAWDGTGPSPVCADPDGECGDILGYLSEGLYYRKIKRWMEYFPLEFFHFVKSEDFLAHPQRELEKVCDFLNIDRMEFSLPTSGNIRRQYGHPISAYDQHRLRQFFGPHNEALSRLIHRDMAWW